MLPGTSEGFPGDFRGRTKCLVLGFQRAQSDSNQLVLQAKQLENQPKMIEIDQNNKKLEKMIFTLFLRSAFLTYCYA